MTTTFTVMNTSDNITKHGSLPYVIQQLNTTSGDVVINFSSDISEPILITTPLPPICSPATSISIENSSGNSITIANDTTSSLFNFENSCGSNLTSISILGSFPTCSSTRNNNLTLFSPRYPAINFNLTNDSNFLNILIQNVNFQGGGIIVQNSDSNRDSIKVQYNTYNSTSSTTTPMFFNCSTSLSNTNIISNIITNGSINNLSNNNTTSNNTLNTGSITNNVSNINNNSYNTLTNGSITNISPNTNTSNNTINGSINNTCNNIITSSNTLTNGSINNTGTTITIDNNMLMGNGCNITTNPVSPFSFTIENNITITGNTLQTTGSITINGFTNPGDNFVPTKFSSTIDQNTLSDGAININNIQISTINNNTLATGDINVKNKCNQPGTPIPATTTISNNNLNSNNNINIRGSFSGNFIGPNTVNGGKVNVTGCGELVCGITGGCTVITENLFSSTMSSAQEAILIDHTNARIRNNQILRGYARGITLKKNSQTLVQSNTINAPAGIDLTECVECILIDNNISGGGSVQNSPLRDIRAGQVVNAGISIFESTGNKILNNTVGGVFGHAIHFKDSDKKGSTKHFVKGNKIGFDPDGKPNPNTLSGIHCGKKSNSNVAQCNTIAHNGKGITADTPSALNNTFSANSISENASKGIGLTNGANDDQAFPVLNSAQANGNTIIITGTLTSLPNTTFRIEFFRNPVDRNPITEGKDPLGSVVVKTDTNGFVSFTARVLSADTTGFVSSTATVLDGPNTGDTSEFSLNIPITAGGTPQSAIGFAIFKKYCASEDPCAGT